MFRICDVKTALTSLMSLLDQRINLHSSSQTQSRNSANHFYKSKEKELSAVIDSYIKDKITII